MWGRAGFGEGRGWYVGDVKREGVMCGERDGCGKGGGGREGEMVWYGVGVDASNH